MPLVSIIGCHCHPPLYSEWMSGFISAAIIFFSVSSLWVVVRSLSCNDVKWMSEGANELWQQAERSCLIVGGFHGFQLCTSLLMTLKVWFLDLPDSRLESLNSVFRMVGVILGLFQRLKFISWYPCRAFGQSKSLSALPLLLITIPFLSFFGIRYNL